MAIAEDMLDDIAEHKRMFAEACAEHPGIVTVNQGEYNNIFNSLPKAKRRDLNLAYAFIGMEVPGRGKIIVDLFCEREFSLLLSQIVFAKQLMSYAALGGLVYRQPRIVAGPKAKKWLEGLKPEVFRDNPATFHGIAIEDGAVADDVVRLIPYEIGREVVMSSGQSKILDVQDFVVPEGHT